MTVDAAVAKPSTAELIRSSAIDLFFEHGYEATSLRAIAGKVGIQVGSLYNHLTSKESLLYSIMSKIIEDLLAELDTRLATVSGSIERLRVAIEVHVFFHTARAREVFIGNSELRSLTPTHRRKVVKLRDQYEERFIDIIEKGVADGSFEADDPKIAAWAILAVGTSTSTWFRPDGRLQLEDIATLYTDLVLNGLASGRSARLT
jgi:TetR/AcrR family transcriptional regulator, cholesterol catabolism regulator